MGACLPYPCPELLNHLRSVKTYGDIGILAKTFGFSFRET
jgi:hypothetical protein